VPRRRLQKNWIDYEQMQGSEGGEKTINTSEKSHEEKSLTLLQMEKKIEAAAAFGKERMTSPRKGAC